MDDFFYNFINDYSEENCRNQLYLEEGCRRRLNIKKVASCLNKFKKMGMIIKLNI